MRLSENRALAWIVAAVCIVGSVFGMSNLRVADERNKVVEMFYEGEEKSSTSRHSMDKYLDTAGESAAVMAAEASMYLKNVRQTTDKMTRLASVVSESEDFAERYEAYQTLKKDADALYNAMYAAGITGEKYTNFKTAYDDFFGADKFIQKDVYRERASDFNKNLKGFPASLITGVGGIDPLDTFGA